MLSVLFLPVLSLNVRIALPCCYQTVAVFDLRVRLATREASLLGPWVGDAAKSAMSATRGHRKRPVMNSYGHTSHLR